MMKVARKLQWDTDNKKWTEKDLHLSDSIEIILHNLNGKIFITLECASNDLKMILNSFEYSSNDPQTIVD